MDLDQICEKIWVDLQMTTGIESHVLGDANPLHLAFWSLKPYLTETELAGMFGISENDDATKECYYTFEKSSCKRPKGK
jgi:hypothetical protein